MIMGMEHSVRREYEHEGLTVIWDSAKCVHCGNCVRGLPDVFNAKRHPWIDLTAATPEQVRAQVAECPSGALSLAP
jgi:uncharacterized Fe-S cluster protein YjdI